MPSSQGTLVFSLKAFNRWEEAQYAMEDSLLYSKLNVNHIYKIPSQQHLDRSLTRNWVQWLSHVNT